MAKEWWEKKRSNVGRLLSSYADGLLEVHARKLEAGDWEYVCVRWFHTIPSVVWRLVGGKLDEGGEYEYPVD